MGENKQMGQAARDKNIHQITHHLSARKDDLIREALDHALGRGEWDLSTINGRIEVEYTEHGEIIVFDGAPVLAFGKIESKTIEKEGKAHLIFDLPVARLYLGQKPDKMKLVVA